MITHHYKKVLLRYSFFSLGAVNLTMRVLYISLLVAFSVTLIAPTEANFFKWMKKAVKDVGSFIDKNAKEICKVRINSQIIIT